MSAVPGSSSTIRTFRTFRDISASEHQVAKPPLSNRSLLSKDRGEIERNRRSTGSRRAARACAQARKGGAISGGRSRDRDLNSSRTVDGEAVEHHLHRPDERGGRIGFLADE